MAAGAPIVVLTRDQAANRRWTADLVRAGFAVVSAPMIETAPAGIQLVDWSNYDWLVITSARAVPVLQSRLAQMNLHDANLPAVAAVGPATAQAAAAAGWKVKFRPSRAAASALGQQLEPVNGRNILIARSDLAGRSLAAALENRGAHVTDLPLYTTRARRQPDPGLDAVLAARTPLVFVLASPSAVRSLVSLHPATRQYPAVAIGPTTATAARAAGFAAVYQSAVPTLPSVISALKLL